MLSTARSWMSMHCRGSSNLAVGSGVGGSDPDSSGCDLNYLSMSHDFLETVHFGHHVTSLFELGEIERALLGDDLMLFSAVETPSGTRYSLLRIEPAIYHVDEELELCLHLRIAAHGAQDVTRLATFETYGCHERVRWTSTWHENCWVSLLQAESSASIL